MANVHGMADVDRRDQQRRPAADNQGANMGGAAMARLPFLSSQDNEDPRRQGFFSTLRSILCPYFKPVSFIFMICILDIAVYIGTLVHSVNNGGLDSSGKKFLGPSSETLTTFGAKVIFLISTTLVSV